MFWLIVYDLMIIVSEFDQRILPGIILLTVTKLQSIAYIDQASKYAPGPDLICLWCLLALDYKIYIYIAVLQRSSSAQAKLYSRSYKYSENSIIYSLVNIE